MPFDSNIPLGVKPLELESSGNMLLRALQAQGAIGQNALQGLQLQQGQQSAERTNRLMEAIQDPTFQSMDSKGQQARILQADPIGGQKYLSGLLDLRKTSGQVDKDAADLEHNQIAWTQSLVGAAAQAGPGAVIQAVQKAPWLDKAPGVRDHLLADLQADPGGPVAWATRFVQSGLTPEQQAQQNNPTLLQTDQGIVAVNKDGSGGRLVPAGGSVTQSVNQPYVGRQPAGDFAGDPSHVLAGIQRIANPTDRAGALRAFQNQMAGANPTPDASGIFQGGGAQAPVQIGQAGSFSGPALGAKREEISYHTDPTTGETLALPKYGQPGQPISGGPVGTRAGTLSEQDQTIVDKIARYEMAPFNSSARNPRQMNIMAAVANQNPEYDATQFATKQKAMKDFGTGTQGNSLRSFATATDHLESLGKLVDALGNNDYPVVNKIANYIGQQTGSTAPTTFDAAKEIVGKEVVKAIVAGGGGVDERARISELLSRASSPGQLKAIISEYSVLMQAQRDKLIAQYENTTGRKDAATRFNFNTKTPSSQSNGWSIEKVN